MTRFLSLALLLALTCSATAKDPEVDMTVPEMIGYWGYPVEVVKVTTPDGYILELHRIPFGKSGPGKDCRPVVFMQHGIEADSSNWVINTPSESAGFLFADAGFDVWLGNMRGNTYSKAHTHLSSDDEKFWEFSWDEMAIQDLETMINKTLELSGQESLYYVGHSQGTLTMFSKLSIDAEFNKKIKEMYALAPVGTVRHIKGLIEVAADLFLPEFKLWVKLFGSGEFLPNNWVMKLLAETLCKIPFGHALCDDLIFLIAGPESNQFNTSRTDVYVAHTPAGTSTQNIMHWAQMKKSGGVTRYDYGSVKENIAHYGVAKPPQYDLSTIQTDLHLFWCKDDWIADEKDIHEYLLPTLNKKNLKSVTEVSGFNHLDFIWGLNASRELYWPIIQKIRDQHGGQLECSPRRK